MIAFRRGLAAFAVATLLVPGSATARFAPDLALARHVPSGVDFAQYGGPGFGDPYGPDGGYDGPPPGYGMEPPPGYGAPRFGPRHRRPNGGSERRGTRTSYHGFTIELGGGGQEALAAVEHQIDIVDSVGLSVSTLSSFRRLPIRLSRRLSGGGHYGGGSSVELGESAASDSRPILLHEFMHVYHRRLMPGGYRNPDIRRFYAEALHGGLYEPGSYVLSNPAEFFAVTASCYLYGTVAREPYNRETIRERQPDYYAYLERLFGALRADAAGRAEQRPSPPQPNGPSRRIAADLW